MTDEEMIERIDAAAEYGDNSVLRYDQHDVRLMAIGEVIDAIRAAGFEVVAEDKLFELRARQIPPGWVCVDPEALLDDVALSKAYAAVWSSFPGDTDTDEEKAIRAYLRAIRDQQPASMPSTALQDIAAERRRQVEGEGWAPEHDDEDTAGELAMAAAIYASPIDLAEHWPWDRYWLKRTTRRRDMVKSGALIVAEIDRIDRAALRDQQKGADE